MGSPQSALQCSQDRPGADATSRQHLSDREQLNAAIDATSCPVCRRNLLVTPTDEKQQARLKEVLVELQRKLQEAKAAFDAAQTGAKGLWLLGGLSAS